MTPIVHDSEKYCCNIKVKKVNKSHKIEGDYHGERRTKKIPWEEGVNSKLYIVGHVHFVERWYSNAAL